MRGMSERDFRESYAKMSDEILIEFDRQTVAGMPRDHLPFKPFAAIALVLMVAGLVMLIAGAPQIGSVITFGLGAAALFLSLFVTDWYAD
jgi:hypothetical protein